MHFQKQKWRIPMIKKLIKTNKIVDLIFKAKFKFVVNSFMLYKKVINKHNDINK